MRCNGCALRQSSPGETPRMAQAFTAFFCVLAAYFVIRPVRDRPGAALGSISLPWFYLTIFIVMLTLVPVFGWAVARFRRRRLPGAVHGFSR